MDSYHVRWKPLTGRNVNLIETLGSINSPELSESVRAVSRPWSISRYDAQRVTFSWEQKSGAPPLRDWACFWLSTPHKKYSRCDVWGSPWNWLRVWSSAQEFRGSYWVIKGEGTKRMRKKLPRNRIQEDEKQECRTGNWEMEGLFVLSTKKPSNKSSIWIFIKPP